jgi:hypothetical protein
MAYFQITAKVESVDESSYERTLADGKTETVSKVQLSLVVPSMRERVLCELPLEVAPKTDILDRWEMEESWVVVSADGIRAIGFARSNARAGEKAVGALVVFQASAVREASEQERRELQQARKAAKLQAKQRRVARQTERARAQQAEKQPVGKAS